jgi:hypothetical protein
VLLVVLVCLRVSARHHMHLSVLARVLFGDCRICYEVLGMCSRHLFKLHWCDIQRHMPIVSCRLHIACGVHISLSVRLRVLHAHIRHVRRECHHHAGQL